MGWKGWAGKWRFQEFFASTGFDVPNDLRILVYFSLVYLVTSILR